MPSYVGFLPTPPDHMDAFFELAPVSSKDVVYDLGSGDGRLLFAAIDAGAGKAVGVELNGDKVRVSEEAAKARGLEEKVRFIEADVLDVDLSDASVVFCYLFPKASSDLRPKFEAQLRSGTRVVMESFSIPGWKPDKTLVRGQKQFFLYTMPVSASQTSSLRSRRNAP